ncbi:hypothetical protein VHUM_02223 [Vanrija humicola]|uniref:NADH:flavin oxidoreductase/NADH oxidase N-terminal domain-containing protein n=1 Tax=Vanrija humicola TaxID=5417 RepID=A0A7D8YWQ1_VANHU|nr:hypothetical protein VHUM_02223 [Vanrija humicola]
MTVVAAETPSPYTPVAAPRVPGYHEFANVQRAEIGAVIPSADAPNAPLPKLFEPLTIRGVEWANRLLIAPMCTYSADNGKATDFHLVHYGSLTLRGWGSVLTEATAVLPEGRISPQDAGLWDDAQIASWKRVTDFIHANKGKAGVQLAHAGRKAGTQTTWVLKEAGWTGGQIVSDENGGFAKDVYGASPIAFSDGYLVPAEATEADLKRVVDGFAAAARRAKEAGFDYVQIHGAHGYLLHSFASPNTNKRTDAYGGSYDNRVRLALEVARAVRAAFDGPVQWRISATEWIDGVAGKEKQFEGEKEEYAWWGIEQTTRLAAQLRDAGVDLLDLSSGGNDARQQVPVTAGYQAPFAAHVKANVPGLRVGAVGIINTPELANAIVAADEADFISLGREALRNADWPLHAAAALGVAANPAEQYRRAWGEREIKGAGTKVKL